MVECLGLQSFFDLFGFQSIGNKLQKWCYSWSSWMESEFLQLRPAGLRHIDIHARPVASPAIGHSGKPHAFLDSPVARTSVESKSQPSPSRYSVRASFSRGSRYSRRLSHCVVTFVSMVTSPSATTAPAFKKTRGFMPVIIIIII